MHAKHDYNPLQTAYPIDSIPPFDEEGYPQSPEDRQAAQSEDAAAQPRIIVETEDSIRDGQDHALLEKQQQAAFHQSKHFQGAEAYQSQEYEPTSTELESKISWGLLIACGLLVMVVLLFCGTIALFSVPV